MNRIAILLLTLIAGVSFAASPIAIDAIKTRLMSCDRAGALRAARDVLDDPVALNDPVMLFTPSLVLFDQGERDEAIFWFYAAQLRMRYQAAVSGGDYNQVLSVMLMSVGPPISTYAFQDTAKLSQVLDRVLEWDKTTPNPLKVAIQSDTTERKINDVYLGIDNLKVKLRADSASIQDKAKREWEQYRPMLERPLTSHCANDAQAISSPGAVR